MPSTRRFLLEEIRSTERQYAAPYAASHEVASPMVDTRPLLDEALAPAKLGTALTQSHINSYNIKKKVGNRITTDMKLRNGKYSSGKVFTKASDTGSAKAKLKRQSNLCVLSETSGDSSGNKTIKDNFSTQKSLGTYSASRVTNSNNFAVKTVDQHSSLLNMSSDFPSRSKRSFIKNDLRSSSASSSDAVQSNVTGGKLQDNRPIVIDMTSGEEVEKVWNQKPKSSRNSIRNKERDCTNVVPVKGTDDLQVEVICSSKKKRNRSVEVVSRNVRTKRSDSVSSPTTKKQPEAANDVVLVSSGNVNRGPSIDDDCSIISIGSDEEIVVLDSTTKSKLNVNNSSDIIILDTPSPQKKKNSTVIDLCTPLNQSTPLRTQPKSKKDIECLNTRSLEPSISQQSQFKNYVSVLGSENNKSNFRATASGSVSTANEGSRNVWVSSGNFIPVTSCNPVWFAPSTSKYGNNIYNPNPDTVREGFRPVTNDGSNVATSCNPVRSALAPSTSKYGSNIYNPNPDAVKEGLRPIVIDGSNVAMGSLGCGTTSFDGEIIAISECFRNLLCHINKFRNAVILSDSKAAILSIVSKHTPSSQTAEIIKMLSQLISLNKIIVFQWIPSHCGILGNENADALAKKGSTATYRPVTKSTYYSVKRFIKSTYLDFNKQNLITQSQGKKWNSLLQNPRLIPDLPRKLSSCI
ncbi:hypothetical protein ANN_25014 [Periplaneta americana]|uniref:RNase H type-1 domain-containing protein n=1 Tax=Periplaneta americana TaxID=6978 RepID=A0ABQ8S066_PERAM|nr:hypothetical protein ANN_25014 [Periplaneta americana]